MEQRWHQLVNIHPKDRPNCPEAACLLLVPILCLVYLAAKSLLVFAPKHPWLCYVLPPCRLFRALYDNGNGLLCCLVLSLLPVSCGTCPHDVPKQIPAEKLLSIYLPSREEK